MVESEFYNKEHFNKSNMGLHWEGLNQLKNTIWDWHSSVKSEDELFLYLLKFFSKYKVFSLSSHFSQRLHALFFTGVFPLYGPVIFKPSPPLVGHVDDLLDACPIRNLLEVLWVAVNWDIFAQWSFPHKCS